ncbi:MAG: hypothetical protein JRG86_05445 [Deltaproteobacteria bacterium]|jgi:uncharacterized membrane protein YcjF (UPF0283 family)|nr:hypothetical protein [Deltaproteobacteria bacterium]
MADRTARFSSWFQIISNVAIIFGLGLVVYELNQSKQLAWAQWSQADIQRVTSLKVALIGDDPREALAKAALHPADLNERDVVALDAYYQSVVLGWAGVRLHALIAGNDAPWRAVVATEAPRVFGSEPGRRWVRAWAASMGDIIEMKEISEIAQKALQDDSDNFPRSQYELLLANE